MAAKRKYELKQRAERQQATRQRIVDAAIALHATVGPAQTRIKGIAERAGVQRHTVYRHFPTEDELFAACSATWDERNPFPDPALWEAEVDPVERLRRALSEIYRYYRQVEPDLSSFLRDAELVPAVGRAFEEDAAARAALRDRLAHGWGARGRRQRLLLAAIGHALGFETWRSLARGQALEDEAAAELMTRLALATANPIPVGRPAAAKQPPQARRGDI
jgi:AcrR family transcriptional regulator